MVEPTASSFRGKQPATAPSSPAHAPTSGITRDLPRSFPPPGLDPFSANSEKAPPIPGNKPSSLRSLRSSVLAPAPFLMEDIFPEPQPGNASFRAPAPPSSDTWLEVEKPFKFNGNKHHWDAWKQQLKGFFFINAARFRQSRHALLEIASATKPGSHPNKVMFHLIDAVFNPGSPEHGEFELLTQPGQVLIWTLRFLEPYFSNPLKQEEALFAVNQPQGNRARTQE
ncbi:hypothetical protein E8E12_001369 [Didymella heteroderae]|uniref:Uncharacterized protein n=1 Tax=Didymella heteroderae TaxID=1769908 RepID=A0A9P5BVP7_9PLEO|nr:hypothetical protein E8E12_001369 [Didymella heteroderae]